ncbi:hypothetical protein QA640_22790 [Bradyrhizobium sp. CB82]|uniref:hypothetical protein n=1 Tax=Bradyrhizobium sp. CB82 TaxID=3039159 RepID=UPI0024B27525|nr:hypothetical protein [Bradyrhizobium sp. CB82]WFU37322.1 hypothetical protein QA640_22790 [Bradyrhizobium sp. CB82]
MATFELTAPDGGVYHVDAPNEHAAIAALKQVTAPKSTVLNIDGRKVTVDDNFLKLSRDQQNDTVDEIAKSLPPKAQQRVTDPALLAQLNAPDYSKMSDADLMKVVRPAVGNKVTDPALLAQLNGAPIHIGAPDGSIVEFPAGTSDDVINREMKKAYDAGTFGKSPSVPAAPTATAAPSGGGFSDTIHSIREAIHAPTRALENGAFLGLGDRARALIDTALSAGGYGEHLKNEQGETEAFQKAHPIAAPVLEAAGGVIAPAAVVGAAAKGATLGTKTLLGAGAGGGIGAVQGAFGSKDWTDPIQVAKDAGVGAVVGGMVGGTIPTVGKVVGAAYEKAANLFRGKVDGMSRAASNHLVKAVEADTPAAVQARLAELGPDTMLVDAGPALLGKGQGASLNSDEGRSVMQTALTARDKGTNARIQNDVNAALGPYQGGDPQTVRDAIVAHRTAVDNVNYPAALDNAPPVQTAHILTDLDYLIPRSVGNEHRALTNLRDMMMTTERRPLLDAAGIQQYDRLGNPRFHEVPVSQNDAEVLHKVKQELDNVIEYDQPGLGVPAGALSRQQAALKRMRFRVNEALEQQVPGYANANAVSAALAQRAEAVKNGTQYLGNGKTTPSPGRFAAEFDPLSQGEKIAFAKGSRGEVERILGTKANDLQALRGELQGEGGWNTAKLATVHGQDAADELVNTVNRNLKFRDTYNKIVENSQTAQRNAAAKAMKPDPSTETPLVNPNMSLTGLLATGAKKGLSTVVNAMLHNDPTRSYGELARALTEQGAARDARVAAVVDALTARQGNAAAGPMIGNSAAVVAALLGNGAVERLRIDRIQRPHSP